MTIKESDVSEGVALRDHIAEQITHVEQRIKDGDEMGPRIWRIALEDVARENRAVLATVSPPLPSPGVERLKEALEMAARGFRKHGRLWLASNERTHSLEDKIRAENAEALAAACEAALSALPLDGGGCG
jgi:hypothetical protein